MWDRHSVCFQGEQTPPLAATTNSFIIINDMNAEDVNQITKLGPVADARSGEDVGRVVRRLSLSNLTIADAREYHVSLHPAPRFLPGDHPWLGRAFGRKLARRAGARRLRCDKELLALPREHR